MGELTFAEVQTGSSLIKGIGLRVEILHLDLVFGIGRGNVLLVNRNLGDTSGGDASGDGSHVSRTKLVLDLAGDRALLRLLRRNLGSVPAHTLECFKKLVLSD